MKTITLLGLWLTSISLFAEEISRPILVQAERFTLSRSEAYELLLADLSDSVLRQEMLKRVAAKSARLEQFVMLHAFTGQSAELEQINEFPYPSEFESAQLPYDLVLADKEGAAALAVVKSKLPPSGYHFPDEPLEPPLPPPPEPPWPPEPTHKAGIGIQTTPAPNKLTFKNLGDRIKLTAELNPLSQTVKVAFTTETVRYLGDQTYLGVAQPSYQTQKLQVTSAGKVGQAIFLGTCNKAVRSGVPHGQKSDEVGLQFVTVSAAELPSLAGQPQRSSMDPFAAPSAAPLEVPQLITYEQIASKTLRFQFDLISLPAAQATALVETRASEPAMLTRLQEMVLAHKAKAEASFEFTTKSHVMDHAEQVTPFQYAQDFSRFHVPRTLTVSNPKILDMLYLHGGGTEADALLFEEEMIMVAEPKDFTTRKLGLSMNFTAMLQGDAATIKLSIAPELVRHVGERKIVRDKKPVFELQRLETTVMLQSKLPLLLGTMSRPLRTGAPGGNEEDRVSFAFITGFVE
jgi:hypothetical protein